uniref:Uncharacterized protein n=1 Tax=viral metagenome TaxID=1070528 RepID=A0A6M3XR57_9ZZZZ
MTIADALLFSELVKFSIKPDLNAIKRFIIKPKLLVNSSWVNNKRVLFWIYVTTKGTIYLN